MDEKLADLRTMEERTFLHDVANPFATCSLIAEMLDEELKHPHLATLRRSLEKIDALIKARRAILIERSGEK